jgi:hypothetical protein
VTYYKILNGLQAHNGGTHRYPGVGRWTRHLNPDRLAPCAYGYHLARDVQLLDWLGPTIYVAEPCPDHPPVDAGGKWVTCRVRLVSRCTWDDRVARLFAADMAEGALLGERACGREPDVRSWEAVAVARRFAVGDATGGERAAAWAAAGDAARAAAGDAARDAAWAAAYDAAYDAAYRRLTVYLDGGTPPSPVALYGGGS